MARLAPRRDHIIRLLVPQVHAGPGLAVTPVEKCHRGIFQRREAGSKASRRSQNNNLRRHFGIKSI
jgi:hypothetical protein